MQRAVAHVSLDAVRQNVGALRSHAPGSEFMAVVKADGYGHGMIPVARACREAGASYLGVALPSEAIDLRRSGDVGPILAWLYTPDDDVTEVVAEGVDLSVASLDMLAQATAAARTVGRRGRIHLKVDTGLGRNGCPVAAWAELVEEANRQQNLGHIELVGIWSHLACADEPTSTVTQQQVSVFEQALLLAADLGVDVRSRHLANSAGTLVHPATHFDMVRCGISVYGLSPGEALGSADRLGLVPAMTVQAGVALVKNVPAGQGVSYGLRYHTTSPTRLALIPVGYGDGLPRAGSGRLPIQIGDHRFTVAGTIAMDQVVLDVGDMPVGVGDVVELFGTGRNGAPTAADWAQACDTINYEIVTRLGWRIPRSYA